MKTPGIDSIVEEIFIEAPPERVFRALTDPEELLLWWGDPERYWSTAWTADLKVGGFWRSEGRSRQGGAFVVEGEFIEIDPPRALSFTWRPGWTEAGTTTVRIVLEPREGGTHLTWTHSGFASYPKALVDHRKGLPGVVTWLKAFLDRRRP